jgi:hypothetical protein
MCGTEQARKTHHVLEIILVKDDKTEDKGIGVPRGPD